MFLAIKKARVGAKVNPVINVKAKSNTKLRGVLFFAANSPKSKINSSIIAPKYVKVRPPLTGFIIFPTKPIPTYAPTAPAIKLPANN